MHVRLLRGGGRGAAEGAGRRVGFCARRQCTHLAVGQTRHLAINFALFFQASSTTHPKRDGPCRRSLALSWRDGPCRVSAVSYHDPVEAAFFDLDKTIISKSSSLALTRTTNRPGLVSRATLPRVPYAQLAYLILGAQHTDLA